MTERLVLPPHAPGMRIGLFGGTLYSDALSEPGGPAASTIDMMRSNVGELSKALAP